MTESKRCKIVQIDLDHFIVVGGPYASHLGPSESLGEVWAWLVGLGYKVAYSRCNKPPKRQTRELGGRLADCPKHGPRAHVQWPGAWQ